MVISQTNTPNTREIGSHAENCALKYLLEQGLKLIKRNYHCKCGEIDLIMADNKIIVFVEVRYRKNTHYGSGAETIDFRKQKKLLASATHFLQNKRMLDRFCRFDVISVCQEQAINNQTENFQINWIPNAFQA